MHGSRLDLAELCRDHAELRGRARAPRRRLRRGRRPAQRAQAPARRQHGRSVSHRSRSSAKVGWGASTWRWTPATIAGSRSRPVPRSAPSDLEVRRRFEREAAIIAALEHPNIVRYLSLDEYGDCLFLTMELVEGETLAAPSPRAALATERLSAIACSLADALAAAHARGIVHRDLKPTNLMWSVDGQLKVLDFGLARLSAPDVESLTRTGCVLGTIPYMAPEQLLGEPADPCSDVYSFGAVLYELAAGRRPFTGRHIGEMLAAIFERAPEPLLSVRPDLPAPLARLIERCLSRDPAQRPRDGAELASELERAGTSRRLEPRPGISQPAQRKLTWRSSRTICTPNQTASVEPQERPAALAAEQRARRPGGRGTGPPRIGCRRRSCRRGDPPAPSAACTRTACDRDATAAPGSPPRIRTPGGRGGSRALRAGMRTSASSRRTESGRRKLPSERPAL